MKSIEWVVFDLGNVLIRVDRAPIFKSFSDELGRPLDEIMKHFEHHPNIWEDLYVREVDQAELAKLVNLPIRPEAAAKALNSELLDVIDQSVEVLQNLKGRVKTACLSNTNSIHWVELMENFPFMKLFDQRLASQHLKLAKPSDEIYHKACEILKTTPDRCIFFDDRGDNIETAKRLGWNAYLFHDPSQLPGQLAAHGIKLSKQGS